MYRNIVDQGVIEDIAGQLKQIKQKRIQNVVKLCTQGVAYIEIRGKLSMNVCVN